MGTNIYVNHTSWWRGIFRRHKGTVEKPYRTIKKVLHSLPVVIDGGISIMLNKDDANNRAGKDD